MFLENSDDASRGRGWIEVITGSMFSGKTEELIRRLKRAIIANQRVEIFKPVMETRYSGEKVMSHDENTIHSNPVKTAADILPLVEQVDVVGIDEAQFFDSGLVEVCKHMADIGARVIVAGLDMDYTGIPFGPVPALLATAEYVTKVHAICVRCGNLAQYSYRKSDDQNLIVFGEIDEYEPLCRNCYREMSRHKSEESDRKK